MNTIEIKITQEDAINSRFSDCTDCALARAIKRAGITDTPFVGVFHISNRNNPYSPLGTIYPKFGLFEYEKLKSGEIKEFVTTFTHV